MTSIEEAEEQKTLGNTFFKKHQYDKAIHHYSEAINLQSKAVYFSNRAFAHVRQENFGLAIADATQSIEIDPTYIKGYYRRGAAHLGLCQYKDAMLDFARVKKIAPKDKDAARKYKECQKKLREIAFEQAIESKSPSEDVDYASITVPESYTGPRWEDDSPITLKFVTATMDYFRDEQMLHKKYVYKIILEALALLKKLSTIVDVPVPVGEEFTVCGDVHGQYYDVLNLFKLNGLPSSTNPYLFNGDFVDRGSWSIECILLFFSWKLLLPNHFHMNRGNHETKNMNQMYGFQGEVKAKVDNTAYTLFCEAFNYLPLGHVIANKVLVVHGGLFSSDGVKLSDLRKIDRVQQPPDSGLMCELMWSDPQPFPGRAPSKRGVGHSFGPDVTAAFLKDNKLELLVRSHEVKEEGYTVDHDGQCVTVFSAPNYCDSMGNKGAFIRFDHTMKPKFTSFEAVPHPEKPPMAYANRFMFS